MLSLVELKEVLKSSQTLLGVQQNYTLRKITFNCTIAEMLHAVSLFHHTLVPMLSVLF